MTPLAMRRLLLYGGATALVVGAAGLLLLGFGGAPPIITPMLPILLLVLAGLLVWAGTGVRRFTARKRTWVTPLAAMRIAVAARASALVASILAGALLGILVTSLARLGAPQMAANALASGLAALAALAWCAAGLLVERWCIVDGDGDDEDGSEPGQPTASPA